MTVVYMLHFTRIYDFTESYVQAKKMKSIYLFPYCWA